MASVGRLVTPRSPGCNTYDNAEDSDEEGTELAYGDEMLFNYRYIDIGTELTNAQDVNTNIPNMCTAPIMDDRENGMQDNISRATVSGAKAGVDLCGNGKVDAASVHILGDDPNSSNTNLPLRKTLHVVEPWMREVVVESNTSEMSKDPFHFEPAEATAIPDLFPVASSTQFFTDMHHLLKVMSIGNVRSVCHHRLRFLEEKFLLHLLENADREFLAQKSAPHHDFYNIRKVDTHVHHSACMNQKHLLRFIKSKLKKEPDKVVIFRDGKYMTLKEVFESLDLTGHDLNVDLLDVHADKSTFHRFDKFNLKYNPCGQSRLREIFLKQDNLIQGMIHSSS
ncbi:AMP deaminase-like [Juglans regia]|uniref:AMP deaminase-like n=1 Tax=Juglans regia TaxID=51240 RepID=A0A6P9ECM6_JUGRE|nr:AMP deaminase-like [Juglans regia]